MKAARYARKNWKQYVVITLMAVAIVGCQSGGGKVDPIVGSWTITVDSPMGTSEQQLTVNPDLTGTVEGADFGLLDLLELAIDGENVTFKIVFEFGGQELPATFEGTVVGDALTGDFITDMGNATVTGVRN